MSGKKRSFIAVRFSEEVVLALDDLQSRLKKAVGSRAKVKWVEPRNIHLTLQFLGDVEVLVLEEMSAFLKEAFSDIPPFEARLSGLGAFPTPRKPRVVWVGIKNGVAELKAVSEAVFKVTEAFGFEREKRPFKPHVTLGRVRDPRKSFGISEGLEKTGGAEAGGCQIDMVHLVASELTPAGPIYTTLDSFPLGR
jgi:2'-5' RNA ligase